ncbi:hypothetical protein PR048_032880 [Dryococelus australis]|uniref:Uncharacterized protein n=1 Tax=Dryococelus australis TaxID=614101 RepID=A0ABQ9G484_9NEOP|nr:hypothetical protein PR048_032880 [Dryococelus australis]
MADGDVTTWRPGGSYTPVPGGRGGVVDRLLASHPVVPGWIPGFSHMGIMPHDVTCRRIFSGISRFPRSFHSGPAPYSLHTSLKSHSYTQHDENTARLFRASLVAAMEHLMRVAMEKLVAVKKINSELCYVVKTPISVALAAYTWNGILIFPDRTVKCPLVHRFPTARFYDVIHESQKMYCHRQTSVRANPLLPRLRLGTDRSVAERQDSGPAVYGRTQKHSAKPDAETFYWRQQITVLLTCRSWLADLLTYLAHTEEVRRPQCGETIFLKGKNKTFVEKTGTFLGENGIFGLKRTILCANERFREKIGKFLGQGQSLRTSLQPVPPKEHDPTTAGGDAGMSQSTRLPPAAGSASVVVVVAICARLASAPADNTPPRRLNIVQPAGILIRYTERALAATRGEARRVAHTAAPSNPRTSPGERVLLRGDNGTRGVPSPLRPGHCIVLAPPLRVLVALSTETDSIVLLSESSIQAPIVVPLVTIKIVRLTPLTALQYCYARTTHDPIPSNRSEPISQLQWATPHTTRSSYPRLQYKSDCHRFYIIQNVLLGLRIRPKLSISKPTHDPISALDELPSDLIVCSRLYLVMHGSGTVGSDLPRPFFPPRQTGSSLRRTAAGGMIDSRAEDEQEFSSYHFPPRNAAFEECSGLRLAPSINTVAVGETGSLCGSHLAEMQLSGKVWCVQRGTSAENTDERVCYLTNRGLLCMGALEAMMLGITSKDCNTKLPPLKLEGGQLANVKQRIDISRREARVGALSTTAAEDVGRSLHVRTSGSEELAALGVSRVVIRISQIQPPVSRFRMFQKHEYELDASLRNMPCHCMLPVTAILGTISTPRLPTCWIFPPQSMSPPQSQCFRVLQAPSRPVGFACRFHTLSSIHATNTSLAVVPQSPVVVHTFTSLAHTRPGGLRQRLLTAEFQQSKARQTIIDENLIATSVQLVAIVDVAVIRRIELNTIPPTGCERYPLWQFPNPRRTPKQVLKSPVVPQGGWRGDSIAFLTNSEHSMAGRSVGGEGNRGNPTAMEELPHHQLKERLAYVCLNGERLGSLAPARHRTVFLQGVGNALHGIRTQTLLKNDEQFVNCNYTRLQLFDLGWVGANIYEVLRPTPISNVLNIAYRQKLKEKFLHSRQCSSAVFLSAAALRYGFPHHLRLEVDPLLPPVGSCVGVGANLGGGGIPCGVWRGVQTDIGKYALSKGSECETETENQNDWLVTGVQLNLNAASVGTAANQL